MIAHIPVWVLVVIRYFQRKRFPGARVSYAERRALIENLMRGIPEGRRDGVAVPEGWLETWLMAKAVTWLTREREALETLERLNVNLLLVDCDHGHMIQHEGAGK